MEASLIGVKVTSHRYTYNTPIWYLATEAFPTFNICRLTIFQISESWYLSNLECQCSQEPDRHFTPRLVGTH